MWSDCCMIVRRKSAGERIKFQDIVIQNWKLYLHNHLKNGKVAKNDFTISFVGLNISVLPFA